MKNEDFVCPECGCNIFKKDNINEVYCIKCGRIITNSDKYGDKYKSWQERNFRPNAWDICYVNYIFDYFLI